MKKIIWVASYPKSGNTWIRAILSSLFYSKNGLFDFKLFEKISNFDHPDKYEFIKSINQNDYNSLSDISVISKYWLEAQRNMNLKKKFVFFKTHSANVIVNKNRYTDNNTTLGLIYIVRDPRDVAISYSKHNRIDIDQAIATMINKKTMARTSVPKNNPYPIFISSWDINYQSWKILDVPKLIIKYETLLANTESTLKNIFNFFEKNYQYEIKKKKEFLKNIIETTDFDSLKKHEKKYGFNEAPYYYFKSGKADFFFRKGQSMQWKNELNKKQISLIEKAFKKTMIELEYL